MNDGDLTPGERYTIIRRAVYDAIWDVIGTIAMLILALIVIIAGLGFLSMGLRSGTTTGWLAAAFGVVLIGLALIGVLREFKLWPFR